MEEVPFEPRMGRSVYRVPSQWVPDRRHVDPYLVGPAGLRPHVQKRESRILRCDAVRRAGRPSGVDNAHAFAMLGVPPDGRVHHRLRLPGVAVHQRCIALGDAAVLELIRQAGVGQVVLRHHQQARGVLVQPVDDAGSQLASDTLQVRGVRQDGVGEGVVAVAGGRVHGHASRLVHD